MPPDRHLLVLADEANFANCSQGLRHTWLFDVREPTNPVSFATMPVPSEADYCAKGGNFGPHNLWENRPGAFQSSRFIFATYHNAGVRVFDIENARSSRVRLGSSCRPIQSACSTRVPTGRKSSSPQTALSMRRG